MESWTVRVATERDRLDPDSAVGPSGGQRAGGTGLAERGVRSSIVRLARSVHDEGDHGLIASLIDIAREKGVSGYVGDGSDCWPAVHRRDAARLFRLAVEKTPAGSVLHGTAEGGVPLRAVAEVIGRHLDLPVLSVPAEEAGENFGWLARFLTASARASNALTRELLDWHPTGPGLIDDLACGPPDPGPSATAAGPVTEALAARSSRTRTLWLTASASAADSTHRKGSAHRADRARSTRASARSAPRGGYEAGGVVRHEPAGRALETPH